jgi:hypothetical protein
MEGSNRVLPDVLDKEMNDEYKIMAVERGDWIEMDRQLMY